MKKKNPQKDNKRQKIGIKRSLRTRARAQKAKTKGSKPATYLPAQSSASKND